MARGGYRKPAKPAPASGPGRHSRRTDGGPGQPLRQLPNAKYGEQAEFQAAQRAAPMASGSGTPEAAMSPGESDAVNRVVPLDAPSLRPDEPITAGAASGAGPGPEALGLPELSPDTASLSHLAKVLPALEVMASSPYASQSLRQYVRVVRSRIGG